MYKRIVVPLDGSELAETILPCVRVLAQHNGAEIVLMQVVEYPPELYPTCYEYPPIDPRRVAQLDEKKQAMRQKAQHYLERLATGLEQAGLQVLVRTCDGPVVEGILNCAAQLEADAIVLSTHAQSGFSHRAIGAVADRVLCEAQVPVLLMRPASATVGLRVLQRAASHAVPRLVAYAPV
jgi:nucleotide-binding universal stress UspA family protein